jgi:hypothetical protein
VPLVIALPLAPEYFVFGAWLSIITGEEKEKNLVPFFFFANDQRLIEVRTEVVSTQGQPTN